MLGGNERRPKGDSFANKERSAEKKKYSFIRPLIAAVIRPQSFPLAVFRSTG